MPSKLTVLACTAALSLALAGCGVPATTSGSSAPDAGSAVSTTDGSSKEAPASTLEDGTYTADVTTDSKMFHVNDALDGKGELTVKDGKMTVHMTLVSQNITTLFAGTAEDAQTDGAQLIDPTTDTVKYDDGTTEDVYGFDVPVPALDQEFDVAILGKKGKWYDHKVTVSNPVAATE